MKLENWVRVRLNESQMLIYTAEAEDNNSAETHAEYGAFTQSIIASGAMQGGNALMPTTTATSVKVRGGKTMATDGPFAETREQLGGYYLVEAKDLDDAVAIAARIPGAKWGTIEVRPIMDVSM